jgi:photosystem II stability/assembly factor-like uncharacterized protein
MRVRRTLGGVVAVLTVFGTSATAVVAMGSSAAVAATTVRHAPAATWKGEFRTGNVRLAGEVPLDIARNNSKAVSLIKANPAASPITLNFGLPLRHQAAANRLIMTQAKNHTQLSRAAIYAEFSPTTAQLGAVRTWLTHNGYTITHVGRDRTSIAAKATTAVIEKTLSLKINDYQRKAYTVGGLKVKSFDFYSNTASPSVPARLGLQSISGLSSIAPFLTDAQIAGGVKAAPKPTKTAHVRSGGYFPNDLRAMYDEAGHGYDATGQTVGFTLWGAGETQPAMTLYANDTGDTPITVDPACVATGNSPTVPSNCVTQQEAPNHLTTILENGNTNGTAGNFEFAGNDETALDIEQAHGMAPGAGMKYYDADCSSTVPVGSGLTNATCNGSDVGMEETMEDAADDPTLHTVSNSWGYGGDTEFGVNDPFHVASQNSLEIGALSGTTFWFSTGDDGSFESGYPADSDYVGAVGGTTQFSTLSIPSASPGAAPAKLSTEQTWAAGGSWCSTIEPRPAWQTGAGVSAHAPCPGRITPDVSAIADTSSSVFEAFTNGLSPAQTGTPTTRTGGVGGTSVAAPEMNGMEAVTENFIAAQNYPGATPSIGFEPPTMYQLGNSGHEDSYFRDIVCGNTASPSGGPDGDAAQPGWDTATGWGALDWFDYSTGYAQELGATGLPTPASTSNNFAYTCAQTPGNQSERAIATPTKSVAYAVGSAGSSTPWPAQFLTSGSYGAVNTFYKSTDGAKTFQTSNGDMASIACLPTTTSTCVEVGDGGRIRRTTDGGATWTFDNSPFNKALTRVTCPTNSICYTAGDRGAVLKSSDGGITWSFTASVDGDPIYGLSCPSAAVCYGTDNYAHVEKTTNGGASWTLQSTPVTVPGINVPGSGGPNPFAGLFSISCSTINACVAVGGFPPTGSDSPIVVTTNGGATWTLKTSNSGSVSTTNRGVTTVTANYLYGSTCVGITGTCFAVGRTGTIVTSTDGGNTWTAMTSNTTNLLNAITCLSTTSCVATGQGGTVDVLSSGTWTPTSGVGGTEFLAGVTCNTAINCYAAGQFGTTESFDSTNIAGSAAKVAGGGTSQQMNAISCVDASDCVAVGNAGTILTTSNGGLTWLPPTTPTGSTAALSGVSCTGSGASATCEAVGAVVSGAAVILGSTNGGATWTAQTSNSTVALAGISSTGPTSFVAVGTTTAGSAVVLTTSNSGGTWTPVTSNSPAALTAVNCVGQNCYAVGAVTAGFAVADASTDGGTTWALQSSNSTQALSSVSCVNSVSCFAGGALGTVVTTTDGGRTWAQQGNPLSGPTSALNAGPASLIAILAASCTSAACDLGTGSSGNIMTTPVVTVSVSASGTFGQTPDLSGLTPTVVSPSDATVTGTPVCITTATSTSDVGSYPIFCSGGVTDTGSSVVFDPSSSYTVGIADQTLSFAGTIPDHTFGDAPFNAGVTDSAGLPIDYSGSTGDCTVAADGTVTITGAGSCTVVADQAGTVDFNPAPEISQTFNIAKESQTITLSSVSDTTYPNGLQVTATATSGDPVTVTGSGACSVSPDPVTANTFDVTANSAGECDLTATQGGDDNFLAAPDVQASFNVDKANQTITFGSLSNATFGDADIPLGATSDSGLAVSYTASPSSTCTIVSGPAVHIVGAGTCTVTASQAGNDDFNTASDVQQSFTVAKADQTITFGPLANKTFGDPDFTVSASTTGDGAVSFTVSGACSVSGSTVHITGVGSCQVNALQGGTSNTNAAATVSQSFTIAKGDQTITFAALSDKPLGSADFTVSATTTGDSPVTFAAVSGSTCTVSGDTVDLTGVGSCGITASAAASADFNAATDVTRTFSVTKATPVVSVTATPGTVGPITFTVSVAGTAVVDPTGSATVSDGSHTCTISALTGSGSGTCAISETAGHHTLTASYSGDSSYTTATGTGSDSVGKATPAVGLTSTSKAIKKSTSRTFTYTVTVVGVAGVTPTGTATIRDGHGHTCVVTLSKSGAGHCALVEKAKTTYSVSAKYHGDANYKAPAKVVRSVKG